MSFTALSEIGEYKHILTQSELAAHRHQFPDGSVHSSAPIWEYAPNINQMHVYNSRQWTSPTNEIGNNMPHNNIQPSIVVYIFKRMS